MIYHLNDNGQVLPCHAEKEPCPFTNHFTTEKDGYDYYAKQNNNKNIITFKKTLPLQKPIQQPIINNYELGIQLTKQEGNLTENNYYNPYTITGKINPNSLNPTSAIQLGFKRNPQSHESLNQARPPAIPLEEFKKLSQNETKELTPDENKAINLFTTSSYEWINKELYEPGWLNQLQEDFKNTNIDNIKQEDNSSNNIFDGSYDNNTFYPPVDPLKLSSQDFKSIIDNLDSALDKGPKRQRTVYRAISLNNSFDFGSKKSPVLASEWVAKNRPVGSEIVFDGYTSTTANLKIASDFSEDNGVLYEIITPEGVNVCDKSNSPRECEVLLPRNQRYMVVGSQSTFLETANGVNKNVGRKNVMLVQLVAINSRGEVLDGTNADPIESLTFE